MDLTTTFLKTTTGVLDPMVGDGNRVGDEITLKGISLKLMVELNERYSDVTLRMILVRSAKGDTPTRATLFKGQSGNKMLDTYNSNLPCLPCLSIFAKLNLLLLCSHTHACRHTN